MKSAAKFRRRRHGTSAVEFAVVAPVFFMVIFGIIEFGRMVMVQQMVTSASREGARRAILDGATTDDVTDVVDDYLASGGVSEATVTVSATPSSVSFGQPISVTVSIPFGDVSWLPAPFFLDEDQDLSATTTMCREGV